MAKILGIKLTAPFSKDDKENQIGWAIRNTEIYYLGIIPKNIKFDSLKDYQVIDDFIKSKKHIYKIFNVKSEKEAEKVFKKYSDKHGNIFGSFNKENLILLISDSYSINYSEEDAEYDAILTIDWYIKQKALKKEG